MRHRQKYQLILSILSCFFLADAAKGQGTVGLFDIPHGKTQGFINIKESKDPDKLYVSSRGGYLEVDIQHSDKFTERIRATWEFDKDVTNLRAGDDVAIKLTMTLVKAGPERDDPYKAAYGSRANYRIKAFNVYGASSHQIGLLLKNGQLDKKSWHPSLFSGFVADTYARQEGKNPNFGSHSDRLTLTKRFLDGKTTGFCISIIGQDYPRGTKGEIHYEIPYLFKTNVPGKSVTDSIGNPNIPDSLTPAPQSGQSSDGTGRTAKRDGGTGNNGSGNTGSGNTGTGNSGTGNNGTGTGNNSGTGATAPPLLRPPFNDDIFVSSPDLPDDIPSDIRNGTILRANRVRVKPGDIVRVRVNLWNARDMSNMNFTMSYDRRVAQPASSPVKGSLLSNIRLEANPNDPGGVLVGFADESGISGSGSVVYVPFQATGKPGDRTQLDLHVTTVNDPSGGIPTVHQIPGEILIVDENGFEPGDTNGDGEINELDARDALRMSVKLIPVQWQADVDENGEVTSRDATLIMQMIREGN